MHCLVIIKIILVAKALLHFIYLIRDMGAFVCVCLFMLLECLNSLGISLEKKVNLGKYMRSLVNLLNRTWSPITHQL